MEHRWQFDEERYTSDLNQALVDGFEDGSLPQGLIHGSAWAEQVGTNTARVVYESIDNRWTGVGQSLAVLELGYLPGDGRTIYVGINTTIERGDADHMAIALELVEGAIECTRRFW